MPNLKLKKYLLLSLFIAGFSHLTFAQGGNLPYADGKFIHFGFSLGMPLMSFAVTPTDSVRVSNLKPGFSVGLINDLRLNRYMNLRFAPTLNFGYRELSYNTTKVSDSIDVTSALLCIPIHLKYSAERKDNYRPYLIGGGGIYFELNPNKDNDVALKPFDAFIEFGVGCDIYFSFFKLAPELKFALGFNNMIRSFSERGYVIDENSSNDRKYLYSTPIDELKSRILTLTFNFE